MTLADQIQQKLSDAFSPSHIEVDCESHMHNVPAGSEMHFRVVLVTEAFSGLRKVQRHQQVYGALAEEMAGPIHALALHLFSEEEWAGQAPDSPQCMGGSKG
ncbi:BolA/IbaG family iron-sulfur metabolism protein [Microbulbifer bruguierae]|uniref:BolA/IbaG family iron-sulfur metabolism protein n=1 Tax=Microbulbifer bruguierae TaxID=3029061 RepID=A0ABY8NEY2_9GAMM|nr:BolA/IbaG family iron-sulfur metabolism protein [Microbulbifer bruguierae]WGL17486.1 BolA/IbaG family iron-sulfur metabolism protein [Microbulbifer bruguierae]